MVARPVPLEMLQAGHGLLDTWSVSGGHPPHHEVRTREVLKPIRAAAVETFMDGLVNEALKCLDTFPNRQVDRDTRIGIRPRARGVAAFIDVAPNETGRPLGQTIHHRQIVGEISHTWILDLIADPPDVELRKMMIGRLLHRLHFAAGAGDGTPYVKRLRCGIHTTYYI